MSPTDAESPNARKARRFKRVAWLVLAINVVVISVLVPLLGHFYGQQLGESFLFVVQVWAAAIAMAFGFMLYRSRQYVSLARAEVDAKDTRPPVLYLRSFARDPTSLKGAFHLQRSPFATGGMLEEQLREAVAPFGPLVAVGLPGESLPPPGAHRVYFDDDQWQTEVEAMMKSAALVIVLVGKGGAGLGWEIERAFESVERNRLLLLVTRGRRQYERNREVIERAAGASLPAYRRISRTMFGPPGFAGANCFLAFPARGDVEVMRLRAPWFRGAGLFTAEARYSLKPVYERLGIPWTPPPISTAQILGTVVVLALIILFIASVILE